MLSAIRESSVISSTSSVTNWIEEFLIGMSSGMGSNTGSVSHVSANNLGTVVVIPEVV